MKYLARMLAYTRFFVLSRQWKLIRQWLYTLPADQEMRFAASVHAEATRAATHPTPQFYASENVASYSPWGDAADNAFALSRSGDVKEQLNGVAMWLAVVYYETRHAPVDALQKLHVDVAYDLERFRSLHEHVLAIRHVA